MRNVEVLGEEGYYQNYKTKKKDFIEILDYIKDHIFKVRLTEDIFFMGTTDNWHNVYGLTTDSLTTDSSTTLAPRTSSNSNNLTWSFNDSKFPSEKNMLEETLQESNLEDTIYFSSICTFKELKKIYVDNLLKDLKL